MQVQCTRFFTSRQADTSDFSELREVAFHLLFIKTVRYASEINNASVNNLQTKSVRMQNTRRNEGCTHVAFEPSQAFV